jgi:hypothetical protein
VQRSKNTPIPNKINRARGGAILYKQSTFAEQKYGNKADGVDNRQKSIKEPFVGRKLICR